MNSPEPIVIRRPAMNVPEQWPDLAIGDAVTCIKIDPQGELVTSYPTVVVEAGAESPWIAVRARWKNKLVDQSGLLFHTGDTLHEFFSPEHHFNLFSVISPEGVLRGWYANVTYPTVVERAGDEVRLFWHDLYLDVVALPDGGVFVLDEDELAEAGVETSDPELYAQIIAAKNELVRRADARIFPFHER
jgi:hypothetical protein